MRDHVDNVYEVAMVTVLVVRSSRMTAEEVGIIRVAWQKQLSNEIVVGIVQIE